MRRALAVTLVLAGCPGEVAGPPEAGSTGDVSTGPATTGACAPACGELAHCDPVDGRCYCDVGAHGDPDVGCAAHGDLCAEAAARVDRHVCEHAVTDPRTWDAISVGYARRKDVRKLGKYLVPARGDAPLPTVFNDTNYYRLHFCMLKEAFAPLFPGFTHPDYNRLVYFREHRRMYAGNVYEFGDVPEPRFGFTVETPEAADELLTEPEVYHIWRHLQDRLAPGELGYVPNNDAQKAAAAAWTAPRVPVLLGGDDDAVGYEVYTAGTAYGRVRLGDAAPGSFGWQDLLVLESAPFDLVGVMAGAVTGTRQDVLSHLNVLASRRGTPNLFVADPQAAFAPFAGDLVKLTASDLIYTVEQAELADAEAFWAAHRPSVTVLHLPDPDVVDPADVLQIPTATADERGVAVSRFGGKATGLATLYATLDPAHRTPAFAMPAAHYLRFMQDNAWTLTLDGVQQTLSYQATIDAWLADPTFRSDTATRRAWLSALTSEMLLRGQVAPDSLAALRKAISGVFEDPATMVRVRSSSNAEDGLEFNGAGLYASASACGLDPDGSDGGASACDPDKDRRPLDRALKQVWASLWGFGAFEEREYYQIDHRDVAMAALVSRQYEDERANGVAFTGDPQDADDARYTINAQLGEVDVVAPPPGVTAELDRLTLTDGQVTAIERAAASSLVPPGTRVLSDAQLEQLGAVLAEISATYPVDPGEHPPADVLLDLEFKIDAGGALVIKQVRPFLRGAVDPALPSCL
jgi:hypothetical protein